MRLRGSRSTLVGAAAALLLPAVAVAWTPKTQLAIAEEAARLAPPDLAAQLERRKADFRAGVLAPFSDEDPGRHRSRQDSGGSLERAIAEEAAGAIAAIRGLRPFAEVIERLGVVAHYVADANNPLNASAEDSEEASYFGDYLHYVESALPRFPLIFYGLDPALENDRNLSALVDASLARGRQLYPLIGREYRRVRFLPGVESFDDRSTAFGVASVSFSRAVNDVALVLRYIWLQAGGADTRQELPLEGERLLLLPRAKPAR